MYRYNEINYNDLYLFDNLIIPIYDTEFDFSKTYMNHMLNSIEQLNDSSWEDTVNYSFTYSNVANVHTIKNVVKSVYPNPFSDIIRHFHNWLIICISIK